MQSTYSPRHTPLRYPASPTTTNRIRRNGGDFAVLFMLLLLCTLLLLSAGWQLGHQLRIYTGVRMAGVSIGGLTRAGALEKLTREAPPDKPRVSW